MARATVEVALGARTYHVLIGPNLLAGAGRLIAERFPGARTAVVTDRHVAAHHLAVLEAGLGTTNLGSIVLEPGEGSKTFAALGDLAGRLARLGVERGDIVIALGGGVVGDLAGFAASILRRGVRLVQIPTTLLAQVDSSVGGKTGINLPEGKNLVGAFHQPSLVLADTDVLSTLPARQMRAGYAEVVKYGLLGDRAFFERLETGWRQIFGNDPAALASAVRTCVEAKAAIVARDETETGDRMLLNLGHTFGHALEAWAGYSDRLLHGEAIAIGMAQAFRYSEAQDFAQPGTAARIERHLIEAGLPTRIRDIPGPGRPDAAGLMTLMAQDKKVQRGALTFILVRGIGEAFVAKSVEASRIATFLEGEIGSSGAKTE